VFFWPKDFTFVCPTEIAAFGKLNGDFNDRDAVVYGASIDSEFVHLAWRQNHADLKDLPFPMLADIKRELTTALGILDKNEGVAMRATYIVDPEGIIRFASVTDLNVGRVTKRGSSIPAATLRGRGGPFRKAIPCHSNPSRPCCPITPRT
jgi:peroxiredoxin (alkyl hydroperoxide reductase subunit C)